MSNLKGTWHLYAHRLDTGHVHVLKGPQTEAEVTEVHGGYLMHLQLKDGGEKIFLKKDAGNHYSGYSTKNPPHHVGLEWINSLGGVLIGHVSLTTKPGGKEVYRRDVLIGLKNPVKNTAPCPPHDKPIPLRLHHFHETGKPDSQMATIRFVYDSPCPNPNLKSIEVMVNGGVMPITFSHKPILEKWEKAGWRYHAGKWEGNDEVEGWILPTDDKGTLLITGYYHWDMSLGLFTGSKGSDQCTKGSTAIHPDS